MTYPITPLPSIHQDIFDTGLALAELKEAIHLIEKLLARLAHDILIGVVNAILRALGLGEFVGPVDSLLGMLGHLETQIRNLVANPLGTLQSDISQLIGGAGGTVIGDVVNLFEEIKKLLDEILKALGLIGVGQFGDLIHLLRGLFPAALPQFNGTALSVSVPGFTDLGNGLINYTPQEGIDAVSHLVQQVDGTVITAAHAAQQAVSAAGAAGVNVGSAVAAGQQLIDHAVAAIQGTPLPAAVAPIAQIAQVGNAAHVFGGLFSRHLTGMYNGFTGAPAQSVATTAPVGYPQIDVAAQQVAAAINDKAQQISAINSQLPHFYGGAGANGKSYSVPLGSSPLSGFTTINGSQVYGSPLLTDSQSVSAVYDTLLNFSDGQPEVRNLHLRVNAASTTYLYAAIYLTDDYRSTFDGVWPDGNAYYIPYAPQAQFVLEIGCFVAGVQTAFERFYSPLWYYIAPYGVWRLNTGFYYWLDSVNHVFTFEAVDYTLTATFAGLSMQYTDVSHVSQKGASYLSGGYSLVNPAPSIQMSFDLYDSGPITGPETAYVATQEATTANTWVDLATTTDQVTVNVGSSGMVLVFIKASITCNVTNEIGYMTFAVSGANTIAASLVNGVSYQTYAALSSANGVTGTQLLTGLNPGATTFKLKYSTLSGNVGYFSNRYITAIPL